MQCQRSIMQTSPLRHNLVRRVTVISSFFLSWRACACCDPRNNEHTRQYKFSLQLRSFLYDFALFSLDIPRPNNPLFIWHQNLQINGSFVYFHLVLFVSLLTQSKQCSIFFFLSDRVIKIWRLFPFAQEALAPLMTLYCHETPRLLSVAHHKLCAVFHEPSTASYNTVVFKTTQKSK